MKEVDKVILTKYITKQANDEEIAMAKYLIGSSKIHEEFYVQLYEAWQKSIYYDIGSIDAEKAYNAFLADSFKKKVAPKRILNWSKIAIAASILLICNIGIYYYFVAQPQGTSQKLAQTEINVPKGATRKVVLPDGTKVWINAGSNLKFESEFGHSSRTVYLNGEAYFDIANNDIPFIVKTNHHEIRDIGTVFNVKAYSDDLSFETTVIEGEVLIEGKLSINSDKSEQISVKQQQVLKLNYAPAEGGVLQAKNDVSDIVELKVQKISPAQLEVYTGWTEDLLVFEGITFQEISKILERRYDVQIIINDEKLKNYIYTGSFKNIDDVEKALKILKETTDISYEKDGRNIIIHGSETIK